MKHIFFVLIFFIFSCQKKKSIPEQRPDISFYHWQSYFDVTQKEWNYLEQFSTHKIYVRYFDVDMVNEKPEAIGKITNQTDKKYDMEFIPTIFITNRVFMSLDEAGIDDLADKIFKLIQKKHQKLSDREIKMIQFDCDWSGYTQVPYFRFLETFKKKCNKKISTTIRLHQIKYWERTGVPPVDHFVLMCYNTGDVQNVEEMNSILSVDVVKQYVSRLRSYPEKLQLALPLFSWGVLYRENKLIKLIRNVDVSIFEGNEKYSINGNIVEVLESTYFNGYFFYKGDQLRLETVGSKLLGQTVSVLKNHITPQEIIYYHLDSIIINQFHYEQLENINSMFHHH